MTEKTIEVARSYSVKINTGNFQNTDLFCSAKQEVARKDAEKTSRELMAFCIAQVNADKEALFPSPEPQKKFTFDAKKHSEKIKDDILGIVNDEVLELIDDMPSDTLQTDLDEDNLS